MFSSVASKCKALGWSPAAGEKKKKGSICCLLLWPLALGFLWLTSVVSPPPAVSKMAKGLKSLRVLGDRIPTFNFSDHLLSENDFSL